MPFTRERAAQVDYKPRTAEVDASSSEWLAEAFGWEPDPEKPDDKMMITVRALTGMEIAFVSNASRGAEILRGFLEKLATNDATKIAEAMAQQAGIGDDKIVPEAYDQAIERVLLGIVEPKMERDDVVKLFDTAPLVGYECSNMIQALSNQGVEVGKSKRSTKNRALESS